MEGGSIFVLILMGFTIITVFKGFGTVKQGYELTVERFGRYTRTLRPGFHWIIPWIDAIGHKINMMERVLDVHYQVWNWEPIFAWSISKGPLSR